MGVLYLSGGSKYEIIGSKNFMFSISFLFKVLSCEISPRHNHLLPSKILLVFFHASFLDTLLYSLQPSFYRSRCCQEPKNDIFF